MELTDQWIVGFVDGDGCFRVYKQKSGSNRYIFVVSQDKRSIEVLYALKSKFGCGSVNRAGGNMREYRVTDKDQLTNIILPFFKKNPLQTVKKKDFQILYESLMSIPLDVIETGVSKDWLIGFIDAEANFYVSMVKNYPRPQFTIGLHLRDREILEKIQSFMECGLVYEKTSGQKTSVCYQISAMADFVSIIKMCTTIGNRCLLRTKKRIDFIKFKQIIRLISEQKHLTPEGITVIQKIIKKSVR
jgi:hypothetical protein